MSDERTPATSEPRSIRRLSDHLINKIAAGEVIHRPASALKELLENSLDAGATSIRVTVKDGGMKLLQIQDNGCGIRKSDLPILAERFTTSKLSTFADLSRIATYGFRGEALASISHVAHLSVITKTKSETCAWRASYADGALIDPKTGQNSEPRPVAGNDGTTITIEDMFYNTPTRLSALRNSSEEYSRILDVMTKYAVHNPKVAFMCKKANSPSPEFVTPSSSEVKAAIGLLYGHSIAKELLKCELRSTKGKERPREEDAMDVDADGSEEVLSDQPESWSAEAYFTNANYQAKKSVFLLFINHRLVESHRMKRAFEAAYQGILPKGSSPFMYLSLQIDPRAVDVNVHPTKREVHFLDEENITMKIADAIQEHLTKQSQSRTFEYQTRLPGSFHSEGSSSRKRTRRDESSDEGDMDVEGETEAPPSTEIIKRKVYSHHKVRTSTQDRTLDSMFPVPTQNTTASSDVTSAPETRSTGNIGREIRESECLLTSVVNLRKKIQKGKHRQLTEILEKHIFVGIVDLDRCLSLVQFSTKLYLVNHEALAEELFYQLGVRQFGDFRKIKLEPPPSVRNLLEIAIEADESVARGNFSKAELVDRVEKLLRDRRDMLSDYFSMTISENGMLESIPLLLRDYVPNLDRLPEFLMRLGPQVDWSSEYECFDTFLRELAYFYTPVPSPKPKQTPSETSSQQEQTQEEKAERWQIQHILFPAMRWHFAAPKSLLDDDVVQVADLPELYKVFERC